jgi:hypothetical protein
MVPLGFILSLSLSHTHTLMCYGFLDFDNFLILLFQYKEIAQTNEAALKQIESVHEEYKTEVMQPL